MNMLILNNSLLNSLSKLKSEILAELKLEKFDKVTSESQSAIFYSYND